MIDIPTVFFGPFKGWAMRAPRRGCEALDGFVESREDGIQIAITCLLPSWGSLSAMPANWGAEYITRCS